MNLKKYVYWIVFHSNESSFHSEILGRKKTLCEKFLIIMHTFISYKPFQKTIKKKLCFIKKKGGKTFS